ncbi:mechanosensitive ion channel [Leptothoe sp. ISB3NOV94-8A]|uniref:Small-conductance mechanosensitive channel n=1 Tax=Adonisia turfae CCMR0081 TaxID=2292702 RepID=A0A6M0RF07_9CYAN|nr:mechanosensitive ion channel domain-containing protein [Adonisia turfae]MDV3353573.1 mechanosensitive ion channel [Leptothoe sp. LEGE 181152]NEZ54433.1 small-conductance mechanosensitive channel [Adonisia turfae CCMR0081]
MRRVIFVRIHAVIATGIIAIFSVSGFPAFSQEADGETESTEEQSILVESTIVGDVDPATAITVEDLTIPIDQLELFLKPLTLEELQVEAAAWFLILKDKVQEISQTEIAIKRQNEAIASQEEAAQAVTEAEAALAEAEAALAEASPGTSEYEKATEQLETAKQSLQEANQAVEKAVETGDDLEENEALRETLEEAESEEEIATARQILEEARNERDDLTAGSAAYDVATERIDALDQALIDLESAEEALEEAVPGSPEHQELTEAVESARAAVMEAAEAISEAGLAPEEAAEEGAIQSEEAESALEKIAADIESAEEQADGDNVETEAPSVIEVQAGGDIDAADAAENSGEQLEGVAEELEAVADAESDLKNQLVVNVTALQGEQTGLVDRFTVVLDALDQKGGDTTSYRKYIDAVSGIELDITDTEGLGVRLVSWLRSEEGGLRWGLNLAKFVGILLASVIVSRLLARVIDRVLTRIGGTSNLFRDFAVMVVQRGVLVTGALLALASLGVSLGPILALVGGASFVLAFALQSNLGNFASGLMLLVNKPFDVGDEVKVAGYWAYVDSISLASTKLKAFNGSVVTLPNNTVWGGDIINFTHSDIRKQMIYIYVKFTQDLDKIYQMWIELAASHPQVLEDPAPGWFPWNGHYDYHICVGLSAWTKTDVYWTVYIELLKELQIRLDKMGIELAAPVQEIKFGQSAADTMATQLSSAVASQLPSTQP